MTKLAVAEKLTGASHWRLYDGRGGVWRATRDKSSGQWWATLQNGAARAVESGRTLEAVRRRVALRGEVAS